MKLKKILALVLALAMVLGTMSFSAVAEEDFGFIDEIIEEVSEIEAEEVELFEVAAGDVAKIGDEGYGTLGEAVAAAEDGDVVTVVANISGESVDVEKNITISSDKDNKATLNDVSLTISGTTVKLAVENLKFTGSSYINANNGEALSVINCEADVNPTKKTGRSAFIVLGTSELNHGLKLTVKDNKILSAQSTTDGWGAAIFGWRYIADGSEISGNVFGDDANNERYTFIAVKLMNAMDGATITVADNTVYGTNANYVIRGFDLYQNNSRANTYVVKSSGNVFDFADVGGTYPCLAFNLSGNTSFADRTNVILLDSGSEVNGEALTLADIDGNDAGSDYDKFFGTDVSYDDNGKIIGGTFSAAPLAAYMAPKHNAVENADGTFGVEMIALAKIGNVGYASVAAALEAAQAAGMTDVTINLVGNPTKDEATAAEDVTGLYYTTVFDSLTFIQEDTSTPYYIAELQTGARTNGGYCVFDGVNIVVLGQYIFEGKVKLTNNSVIKSVAEANCFHYYCETTVEPGSKLFGVIDDLRGGDVIVDGGRTDGTYNNEPDMQDAILIINWGGDSVTLKDGAFLKVNSANEVGRLEINPDASLNVYDSKVEAVQYINVAGTLNVDTESAISTAKITGAGKIFIDASEFDGTETQVISANMTGFTGEIVIKDNDFVDYKITDSGVVVYPTKLVKVGDEGYATLADALAAAKAGDTVTLLADITLSEVTTLPAGIKFNGNGKQINGEVWASGDLEFVGHTKVTNFNAGYDKPVITIGEGATLETTSGRMVIGHGATFNITGTIEDAKTADVADLTPSLIVPGASFTGNGVNFNVENAYVKFTSDCTSKNSNANGTHNYNITNSIWEQTGKFAFSTPTNGMDPTFNLTFKDSVFNTTSHIVFAASKGETIIDNSLVNEGVNRQLENRGNMTIKNGSVVYGANASSSNANMRGNLTVDNATYVGTGEYTGVDNKGTLTLKNEADVTLGSVAWTNIVLDGTSELKITSKVDTDNTTIKVDAENIERGGSVKVLDQTTATASLENITTVVKYPLVTADFANGDITLKAENLIAKVGEEYFSSIDAALTYAAETGTEASPATVQLYEGTFEFGKVVLPVLDGVIIKGADNNGTVIVDTVFTNSGAKTDSIKNFTIDGVVFDNAGVYVNAWTQGMTFENWTITNCTFEDYESPVAPAVGGAPIQFNLASGMLCAADTSLDGFTFTNNTIKNVTRTNASGINSQAMKGEIVIEGNTFDNIYFNAVQIQNIPEDATVSVKNNVFSGTGNILHINNNLADTKVNKNVFVKAASKYYIVYVSTEIDASDNFYGIGTSVEDAVFDENYASAMHIASGNVPAPVVYGHYEDTDLTNYVDLVVATIGEKKYVSIYDAVAAANDGDVIKLAATEIELNERLFINNNVTIEGAQKLRRSANNATKIITTGTTGYVIANADAGVTFRNIDFVADANFTGENFVPQGTRVNNDAKYAMLVAFGKVAVEGSNFVNEGNAKRAILLAHDTTGTFGAAKTSADSSVTGSTFTNFPTGIGMQGDNIPCGNLVIDGNTFAKVDAPVNAYWGVNTNNASSVTLTNNNFASAMTEGEEPEVTLWNYAPTKGRDTKVEINVENNTSANGTEIILVDADSSEVTTNSDNVVLNYTKPAFAEELTEVGDEFYLYYGSNTETEAEKTSEGIVYTKISEESGKAAFTGGVYYNSIQAAIDAAATGAEIVVLADAELTSALTFAAGADVILELNGMTINAASGNAIDNSGKLLIQDNGANADGKVLGGKVLGGIANSGTLKIVSGAFAIDVDAFAADGFKAILQEKSNLYFVVPAFLVTAIADVPEAVAGGTITVDVMVTEGGAYTNASWTLKYDPAYVTYTGTDAKNYRISGSKTDGATDDGNDEFDEATVLGTYTFTVNGDVLPGTAVFEIESAEVHSYKMAIEFDGVAASTANDSVAIVLKTGEGEAVTGQVVPYNGMEQRGEAVTNVPAGARVTYSTDTSFTNGTQLPPAFVNVGTHTYYAKVEADGYAEKIIEQTLSITAISVNPSVEWSVAPESDHVGYTPVITGVLDDTYTGTVTVLNGSTELKTLNASDFAYDGHGRAVYKEELVIKGVTSGNFTLTVKYTAGADDNYATSEGSATVDVDKSTIGKATEDALEAAIIGEDEVTYDGTLHYVDIDAGNLPANWTAEVEDHSGVKNFGDINVVDVTFKDTTGKYNDYTATVFIKTVRRIVKITVNNATKKNGEADANATNCGYTAVASNSADALEPAIIGNDLGDVTIVRVEEGEIEGTYEITATYTPNNNYIVKVVNGTLSITDAVSVVEVVDNKYNLNAGLDVEADYTAGSRMILVHTDSDYAFFTYDGKKMYDVSEAGYTYFEHDYDTNTHREGKKYQHVYAIVVEAEYDYEETEANEALYASKVAYAGKDTNAYYAPVKITYDADINGMEDLHINDYSAVKGIYNSTYDYDKYQVSILKADFNKNKLVNTADAQAVKDIVK